jgi:ATP synthase B/B'' CF(0).
MVLESLKEIRGKEGECNSDITRAREEAKKRIEDAENSARTSYEEAVEAAKKEVEVMMENTKSDAEKESEAILSENERNIKVLKRMQYPRSTKRWTASLRRFSGDLRCLDR